MANTIIIIVASSVIGLVSAAGIFTAGLRVAAWMHQTEATKNEMAAYYQAQNKGRTEEERQTLADLVSGMAILQARLQVTEQEQGQLVNELYARIDGLKKELADVNEKLERALGIIVSLNEQVAALTKAPAKSEAAVTPPKE